MRTRTAARAAVVACAVAVALAGCGGGDDPAAATDPASVPAASGSLPAGPPAGRLLAGTGGLGVAEVLADATGEPLLARAYVVVSPEGSARLCEVLAESSPPQCGGSSIAVTGLPPEMIAGLSSRAGVRWTPEPVQLIGTVRAGTFVNDPLALAAS